MQYAPLSNVTLIYGPNSGGKSSILQALMLLKQSLDSPRRQYRRELLIRGDTSRGDVDLGGFPTLVHRHHTEDTLGVSLAFDLSAEPNRRADINMRFSAEDHNDTSSPAVLSSINYRLFDTSKRGTILLETYLRYKDNSWDICNPNPYITVDNANDAVKSTSFFPLWKADFSELARPFESLQATVATELDDTLNDIDKSQPKRTTNRRLNRLEQFRDALILIQDELRNMEWTLKSISTAIGMADRRPITVNWHLRTIDHIKRATSQYKVLSENINNIFQHRPETDLRGPWEAIGRGISAIEQAILVTLQSEFLMLNGIQADYEASLAAVAHLGPVRDDPQRLYVVLGAIRVFSGVRGEFTPNILHRNVEARNEVNRWFQDFNIPYHLEVKTASDVAQTGQNIYIALFDNRTNTEVTIADVGFGISCILPIIVEAVASPEGSVICVEQPELHLHPRLQGHLADLIVDTSRNEPGKRKQWLVETHSEVLLLSLASIVADPGRDDFQSDNTSILFVEPAPTDSNMGSTIIDLGLRDNGELAEDWPPGFFDEATDYLMKTWRSQEAGSHAE